MSAGTVPASILVGVRWRHRVAEEDWAAVRRPALHRWNALGLTTDVGSPRRARCRARKPRSRPGSPRPVPGGPREAGRRPPPVQAGAELPLVLFSSASRTSLAAFDQEGTRFSLYPGYGPDPSTATENRLDKNLAPTNIVPTLDQGEARGQSRIEGRDQEAEPVRFRGTGPGRAPAHLTSSYQQPVN